MTQKYQKGLASSKHDGGTKDFAEFSSSPNKRPSNVNQKEMTDIMMVLNQMYVTIKEQQLKN